ncbi:hypothetical protein ACLOJK_001346, partial [Asimina triloba]
LKVRRKFFKKILNRVFFFTLREQLLNIKNESALVTFLGLIVILEKRDGRREHGFLQDQFSWTTPDDGARVGQTLIYDADR